ncbi:hypothetical protein ATANTOWER_009566, partial [Ataeniobius toweri]|nr:hypothetical protein [Ataeniobius toweri]
AEVRPWDNCINKSPSPKTLQCTITLISKYLSQLDQLDHYSDNLARVVRKKGGAVGDTKSKTLWLSLTRVGTDVHRHLRD